MVTVVGIEQRSEEVGKGAHKCKDRDRRNSRFGERKNDLAVNLPSGGSVNFSSFDQLVRNCKHKLTKDHDIKGISKKCRNDQGPESTDKSRFGPESVKGNHGNRVRDHHAGHDDAEIQVSALPADLGKGKSNHRCADQRPEDVHSGDPHRVPEIFPERHHIEHFRKVIEIEALRPQSKRSVEDLIVCPE